MRYWLWLLIFMLNVFTVLSGCKKILPDDQKTHKITDQIGRIVHVPEQLDRIAALHHFGGKIVFALKQQNKLVEQAVYGKEAVALSKVDKHFASLPNMLEGHSVNIEGIVALMPQVVFVYASNDRSEIELFENAGISVIAVKGETLEESFDAVRLMAKVLNCPQNGEQYITECRNLIHLVQERLGNIPESEKQKVLFTGPKSIYAVATGEMLQTSILEKAGAVNVAKSLNGFWAAVSPEQIALWNPDVIFLGSSLNTYGIDTIFKNAHFDTIKAIKERKIYHFPSNIGWWDYPAPHCVMGVVWSAKTLYPKRFEDIDMLKIADEFYTKYVGYSFAAMDGKL